MKISPVCFRFVAVLAALGVGTINSFSSSFIARRSNANLTALASATIDPIFTPMKPLERESRQTSVAAAPKVAQRWRKRTKQLATLGPASSTPEMIETLFLAGADIFRLNFSHGSQEQKKDLLMMIREVEEKYSHPIAILGDLQGPKLRVRSRTQIVNVPLVHSLLCRHDINISLLNIFIRSANSPIPKVKCWRRVKSSVSTWMSLWVTTHE